MIVQVIPVGELQRRLLTERLATQAQTRVKHAAKCRHTSTQRCACRPKGLQGFPSHVSVFVALLLSWLFPNKVWHGVSATCYLWVHEREAASFQSASV